MALRTAVHRADANYHVKRFLWEGLLSGDTASAVEFAYWRDRCVQVVGTFGGATVTLEGSIDGTTYAGLTDPQGVAISLTSAGLSALSEATPYIKPVVTGGDGTTDLDVWVSAIGGER